MAIYSMSDEYREDDDEPERGPGKYAQGRAARGFQSGADGQLLLRPRRRDRIDPGGGLPSGVRANRRIQDRYVFRVQNVCQHHSTSDHVSRAVNAFRSPGEWLGITD